MRILFSILFNGLILFFLAYLLGENSQLWLESWITVTWGIKTYAIGGVILGLINITIRPILKILSIPLFFVFLWLITFVINWAILLLLDYIINNILIIPGVAYTINWWENKIIAIAIFTILNMFYSLLFTKK